MGAMIQLSGNRRTRKYSRMQKGPRTNANKLNGEVKLFGTKASVIVAIMSISKLGRLLGERLAPIVQPR